MKFESINSLGLINLVRIYKSKIRYICHKQSKRSCLNLNHAQSISDHLVINPDSDEEDSEDKSDSDAEDSKDVEDVVKEVETNFTNWKYRNILSNKGKCIKDTNLYIEKGERLDYLNVACTTCHNKFHNEVSYDDHLVLNNENNNCNQKIKALMEHTEDVNGGKNKKQHLSLKCKRTFY